MMAEPLITNIRNFEIIYNLCLQSLSFLPLKLFFRSATVADCSIVRALQVRQ